MKIPPAVDYFKSLPAIRERCSLVFDLAQNDKLEHWRLDLSKLDNVYDFVHEIIKRDYPQSDGSICFKNIPPHSRWRHFEAGNIKRIDFLLKDHFKDAFNVEKAKCLVDLFVVSVLLDAGAGAEWKFKEAKTGMEYGRSEGLALASLEMFCQGKFSSNPSKPFQVDSQKLQQLELEDLEAGFQVSQLNPLVGLDGRLNLLRRLGLCLQSSTKFFIPEKGVTRPSSLIEFLLENKKLSDEPEPYSVDVQLLWKVIIEGFGSIWPESRTQVDGISLGDAWNYPKLDKSNLDYKEAIIPFHKLSQWLAYSLIEPLEVFGKIRFYNQEFLTGLPEYRNGGLFIDFGVITIKSGLVNLDRDQFSADDSVVIEWRALTVILIDKLANLFRKRHNLTAKDFPLAVLLEGGTWKAGREIAAKLRPKSKDPPIKIISDGTVF